MIKLLYICKHITNIATIIVLVFLIFVVIMIPLDGYEFWTNPEQYISVYHLDTTQPNWKVDFIRSHIIAFPIALVLIGCLAYSYRRPKNTALSIIKIVCVWLIVGFLIYSLYSWAQTGFDH